MAHILILGGGAAGLAAALAAAQAAPAARVTVCLLYTSDAADEDISV